MAASTLVASGRRVLMRDFDGVLHRAQGDHIPEFAQVPYLEQALGDAECSIVISSTWREHYALDALRSRLRESVGRRISDQLGPDLRGPFVRHKNILAWLQANPWCTNWRALNDTASEFPPDFPFLILCDGREGMGEARVLAIREWLAPAA